MPRGDWRYVAAAFVCVETVLVAFFLYSTGSFSGRSDREAEGYAAHYAASADQRIKQICVDPSVAAICVRKIMETTHENERSEAYLDWQRQAAEWAWWSVIITAGQTLVGAIGLIALFRSLGQTNQSLREAGIANKVAMKENARSSVRSIRVSEQTQESLQITRMAERAHLLAIDVSFDTQKTELGFSYWVSWHVKNFGRTPGFIKKVPLTVLWQEDLPAIPLYADAVVSARIVVPPDQTIIWDVGKNSLTMTGEEYSQFYSGGSYVHVWGRFDYDDVFGEDRTSGFVYRISCKDGKKVISEMIPRLEYWQST